MAMAGDLINEYKTTRSMTERLCEGLLIEDYVIQSMEDVSPPKWHLAHTTWFFETFILSQYTDYKNPNPFAISNTLVSNQDYLEFILDRGYCK